MKIKSTIALQPVDTASAPGGSSSGPAGSGERRDDVRQLALHRLGWQEVELRVQPPQPEYLHHSNCAVIHVEHLGEHTSTSI